MFKYKTSNICFTPNVPLISFSQLESEVARAGFDPISIALTMIDIARRYIPDTESLFIPDRKFNRYPHFLFHTSHVGAVILAALSRRKLHKQEVNKLIPEHDALSLIMKATGLTSESHATAVRLGYNLKKRESELLKLRLLCTQLSLQGEYLHRFAQTLYLLGLEDIDSGKSFDESPFDSLFQNKYECTTREYMALMFLILARYRRFLILTANDLLGNSANRSRLASVLTAIIKSLSCPVNEVQNYIRTHYRQYQAEGLVQAFYSNTPFIEINA